MDEVGGGDEKGPMDGGEGRFRNGGPLRACIILQIKWDNEKWISMDVFLLDDI
jgi:hypothetical protein